jgi:hypothetical protein
MKSSRLLFYFSYLFFSCLICCTAAFQCDKDDQQCHHILKQSALISSYEKEVEKYHTILASSNCSICNLNGINPCQNNGTCQILDSNHYVCECLDAYSGKHCETHITCGPHDCGKNASCNVFNHNKVCSCPIGYSGDPRYSCNVKTSRACIRGDPHYSTFDGSYYTYMGTCPYIITQTFDKTFSITGYNEFRGRKPGISYLTHFDLFTKNTNIQITKDLKLYVNGIRHFFPHYYPSLYNPIVKITKSCDYIKIHDYSTGAKIDFKDNQLCVTVPSTPLFYGTGKTGGALGDIDGQCLNDFKLGNGTLLDISGQCNQGASVDAAIFVDSWVTNSTYDNCVLGKIIQNNTNCDTQDAQLQCSTIRDAMTAVGPFAKCLPMTSDVIQQYFEDCVFDVCQGYDRCSILANFATSCLEQVPWVVINAWRDLTNCPWPCPPHSTYSLQTPICQNTCADPSYSQSPSCQDGQQEGCKCMPGYYLDSAGDGTFPFSCRRLSDCGCTDSYGNYYPPHTHWTNGDCTIYNQCENGTLTSQPVICSKYAQCNIISGEPTCQCMPGYTGSGYTCQDVNECQDPTVCNVNLGHGTCNNTMGSYYCNCIAPWGGEDCSIYLPKRHCADWYRYHGARSNGVYNISIGAQYPNTLKDQVLTEVYCDMETNGGGWTLASHGNNTAGKTYNEYKIGFGIASNQQVWLGLENLHLMTNQTSTSLRVVIERCRVNGVPDTTRECTYPTFSVLNGTIGYPVYIPEYCQGGNETTFDGFDGWVRWPRNDIGPIFTTFDHDSTPYNCSAEYKGTGWWFYASKQGALCGAANLNGLRQTCNDNFLPQGYLSWHYDPIEDARMYLRPSAFPNYDSQP